MSEHVEKFEFFVEGEGLDEMVLIEVDPNETVEVILARAKELGADVHEDTIVLVGEQLEPVDRNLSIHNAGIRKHHRVHVHRCKEVMVKVTYNGDTKAHNFRANQTVASVRNWALDNFPVDPAMKVNMILRFAGTTKEPDLDRHIGTYAKHGDCEVSLDFILDPRVQG